MNALTAENYIMEHDSSTEIVQLRFRRDGEDLTELNAAELADCLLGLTEYTGIMSRQGLFDLPTAPEVMVRPLKEGSFIIEASLWAVANPVGAAALLGGAGAVLKGAQEFVTGIHALIKKAQVRVKDYSRESNGLVKIYWQDETVDEVPEAIWRELQSKNKRSKRALKNILSPLGGNATSLEVRTGGQDQDTDEIQESEPKLTLSKSDYAVVVAIPDDIEEEDDTFEAEGRLITIDFDRPTKWKIAARGEKRTATIEDDEFLQTVDNGRALRKDDIFRFQIREDIKTVNGRTQRTWAIVKVLSHTKGVNDESVDGQQLPAPQAG